MARFPSRRTNCRQAAASASCTGDELLYSSGGGTAIGGLVSGNHYFVIQEGNGVIRLASSAVNAANGTAINLTTLGTGGQHSFSRLSGDEATIDPDLPD